MAGYESYECVIGVLFQMKHFIIVQLCEWLNPKLVF